MNTEIPKWVRNLIVLTFVVVGLMVFFARDRLHVYEYYLREKLPRISTDFAALSADMDEAALRKHYASVPLRCVAQGPIDDSLGERVCYESIERADGDAALALAAFFHNGKLVRVMVQTPWWVHASWIQRLTTQYGSAVRAVGGSTMGAPSLRWTMPNGHVEINRDRSWNLLKWNVILWTPSG